MSADLKEKIDKIDSAAIEILETVGIKLFHPETLDTLTDHNVKISGQTAFFKKEMIYEWLSKAPETFELCAVNPQYNSVIGKENSEYVSAYGCSAICELDGTRRSATLDDYIEIARLIHQSPRFNINGGILAQPSDVPADKSHLIMLYAAMMTSDKCLMGVPGSRKEIEEIMALLSIRFGGSENFRKKSHLLTMISTISPLQMDEMALSSIMAAARNNQPLIISPAPAAGTTGPIDLAANLALATAEALAGIVITQMFNPGNPVLFGLQCYGADLKSGNISIGSPAYALQARYCAALARRYGVPSRCGGTTSDAKVVSAQSGYESMLSMFTACENRVNLIVHSAGILDSFGAFSYEKFLIDLEIIDMVQYYLGDIEVNESTLNLDLIRSVGPGGEFLTTMDTMKKCRTHSWMPQIGVRGITDPKAKPMEKFIQNINTRRKKMLESYALPKISMETQEAMDSYMVNNQISPSILERIRAKSASLLKI